MRQLEIDPEITASLDAIDAALAGEEVDPRHAELAELAVLLVAERAEPDPVFARSLDERVAGRFAAAADAPRWGARVRRGWPAAGALAAAMAASIAVIAGLSTLGGSGSSSSSSASGTTSVASSASLSAPSSAPAALAPAAGATHRLAAPASAAASLSPSTYSTQASAANGGVRNTPAPGLQLPSNGRKTIQSAQVSLATAPDRVDDVSQEVLNVVAQENGIVKQSSVTQTGGPDGYATFQLSIPTANLGQAMARLSSLPNAQVASRTDASQDVNDTYDADVRRLADAQALRSSLLKQLAAATTQSQTTALEAQIRSADAQIASAQGTLNLLNQHISFSQVQVTIQGDGKASAGPAFTIGRATHDAGRVLTVVAGAALIALAALLPIALLVALAWWVGALLRRRRREHALDVA